MKDDRAREKLLGKRDLDLDKATETVKASQVTHSRAGENSEEFAASEEINAVKHKLRCHSKGSAGNPRLASLSLQRRVPRSLKSFYFCFVLLTLWGMQRFSRFEACLSSNCRRSEL